MIDSESQAKAAFVQAIVCLEANNLSAAEELFRRSLELLPNRTSALINLSGVLIKQAKYDEAWLINERLANLQPYNHLMLKNRGILEREWKKQYKAAEDTFKKLKEGAPDNAEYCDHLGLTYFRQDKFSLAKEEFSKAHNLKPSSITYLLHYAISEIQIGGDKNLHMAKEKLKRCMHTSPRNPELLNHYGIALIKDGDIKAAIEHYQENIIKFPGQVEFQINLGNALALTGNKNLAKKTYQQALQLVPDNLDAVNNLANLYLQERQMDQAICLIEQTDYPKEECNQIIITLSMCYLARNNLNEVFRILLPFLDKNKLPVKGYIILGVCYEILAAFNQACEIYVQGFRKYPNVSDCLVNLGNLQGKLELTSDAVNNLTNAINLDSGKTEAYLYRGLIYFQEGKYLLAQKDLNHVIVSKNSDFIGPATACLLELKLSTCDWEDCENLKAAISGNFEFGDSRIDPYIFLLISNSSELQKEAANKWIERYAPQMQHDTLLLQHRDDVRIKIGYFSTDFYAHPVGYLTSSLFKRHDRKKFELFGFTYGPRKDDEITSKIKAGFDHFIDIRAMGDREVANFCRTNNINIVVDMNGLTRGARPGIFSLRAAPIQINYLGYPGTSGASYFDFIVADSVLIPPGSEKHYAEKIIYMPDTYQPNEPLDNFNVNELNKNERTGAGLPVGAFVYCCFNKASKINASVFGDWMMILRSVPGSVLWLLNDHESVCFNLWNTAIKFGVTKDRIIFAGRLNIEGHLKRQALADLFLDTHPYSAHTTASDALRAGLPLLTFPGETFASRVAASLLTALGLEECIAKSKLEYVELAIKFGSNSAFYYDMKKKLISNRNQGVLFDSERYVKNLEKGLCKAWEQYIQGIEKTHIWI